MKGNLHRGRADRVQRFCLCGLGRRVWFYWMFNYFDFMDYIVDSTTLQVSAYPGGQSPQEVNWGQSPHIDGGQSPRRDRRVIVVGWTGRVARVSTVAQCGRGVECASYDRHYFPAAIPRRLFACRGAGDVRAAERGQLVVLAAYLKAFATVAPGSGDMA